MLFEAELFVSLLWLFDVIFSCWLQRPCLPDRSKGRCYPFLRCFELLSGRRKQRRHLPPPLVGQRVRVGDVPLLAECSEQSLGGKTPSVPLELLFNVSYNHLHVQ